MGGIAGVGVTFLEETFSAATAAPQHRFHQKAAQEVLRALLPASGTSIKGRMRSADDLLKASGYENRPAEFDELIRILNTEVRLITPTDPEGGEDSQSLPLSVPIGQKYYQLTHDYLVPPLREWLTRKDKQKLPGRARLLLEERTREWAGSNQDRFLPSLRESLVIALCTRRSARSKLGQDMVRRAFWVHGRRIGFAAALLATFVLFVRLYIAPPRAPMEVLKDAKLPAKARLMAFDLVSLEKDADFIQVLTVTEEDKDDAFVRELLGKFVERVKGDRLLAFTKNLLADPSRSPEFRAAVFAAVQSVTAPKEIFESLRNIEFDGKTDSKLAGEIAAYIDGADLAKVPENDKPAVVGDLLGLIRAGRNASLAAAARKQLDKQSVDRLCEWIIESIPPDKLADPDQAAEDSVGVYIRECDVNGKPQRLEEIGREVQKRLLGMADHGIPDQTRDLLILEYRVRVMLLVQKETPTSCYRDALHAVSALLRGWTRGSPTTRGDTTILVTLIETYAELRFAAGDRDPVRTRRPTLRCFAASSPLPTMIPSWPPVNRRPRRWGAFIARRRCLI